MTASIQASCLLNLRGQGFSQVFKGMLVKVQRVLEEMGAGVTVIAALSTSFSGTAGLE